MKKLKKNELNIKITALLHDIGHGPFSHVWERIFKNSKKHEEWTTSIIIDKSTEINQKLEKHKIDPREIEKIIQKTHPETFVVDIVSSQIDADRMDYLLRDALMTGVSYGNFDFEWLLHTLRIGKIKVPGESRSIIKLCIDGTKGIRSIEEYILARFFMYKQVYFHKTTRAYEALFTNIFKFATYIKKENDLPDGTPPLINEVLDKEGDLVLQKYLLLDDALVLKTIENWAKYDGKQKNLKELAKMCQALFFRHTPYKPIELDHEKYRYASEFIGTLKGANNLLRFHCYLDNATDTPYKGILYNFGEKKESNELLNLPIYIIQKDSEEPIAIETKSDILKPLQKESFEQIRFFYDRTKEKEFMRLLREHTIDILRNYTV